MKAEEINIQILNVLKININKQEINTAKIS